MSTIAAYIIGFNSEIWMQKNDAPRKMGKEGGVGGGRRGTKRKNGVEQPLAAQHADGRRAQLQNEKFSQTVNGEEGRLWICLYFTSTPPSKEVCLYVSVGGVVVGSEGGR